MVGRRFLMTVALCLLSTALFAQTADNGELLKYKRSSLYSILIHHEGVPYADQIETAFMNVPIPDKFNDHNLLSRELVSSTSKMRHHGKKKDEGNKEDIDNFIQGCGVGNQLVAKWFNRDAATGGFDMSLVQERGYYDASKLDIALAEMSDKGLATLGDAGEGLIGNTFLLANDITYVDKGQVSQGVAAGISLLAGIAGAFLGSDVARAGKALATAANEIDGFTVNITSYLYRLVWDDATMGTFYKEYWYPTALENPERRAAFDTSSIFRLEYVGSSSTSAAIVESKHYSKISKADQMLKACARAVDKSIVGLQRTYDEFKVNVPIYSVAADKKTAEVKIGLKEGITEKSEFEVLAPVEDKDGKIHYNSVGRLKPVKGRIWDNRFGALEEAQMIEAAKAAGEKVKQGDISLAAASLTSTTFKVLSGANQIYPGCLIREVKFK